MTPRSDDKSSASRSDRRKPAGARNNYYMIAPAGLGETRQTLIDLLKRGPDVEIVQTYTERGGIFPPVAVVRAPDENLAALRRSAGGALVIETDRTLRAASLMGEPFMAPPPPYPAMAAISAVGPAFAVTIRVLSAN